jgi:hypothetical protein
MHKIGPFACLMLTLACAGAAVADQPEQKEVRYPASTFGPVNILDEQDPRYQSSVDDLAAITRLLEAARAKAAASKETWTFPGFDYAKLDKDILEVERQLNIVLAPRTMRLRYQQLVPDSSYFHPASGTQATPVPSAPGVPPGAITVAPAAATAVAQDLPPPSSPKP